MVSKIDSIESSIGRTKHAESCCNDLPAFIKKVKDEGFKVKLDTNGSNSASIEKLLKDGYLDYIALDIKTSFAKYQMVTKIEDITESLSRSIEIIMKSSVPYEFRTTCVPEIVDEKDFLEMGTIVKGAKKYCLQQFRSDITLDPHFQEVKPYSKDVLEKFKSILADFVQHVEIRGI